MSEDDCLKIDVNALDEELVTNPSLVSDANDAYAEAVAQRDTEKDHLDTVEARLDAIVRAELRKSTEGAIKAAIQVHPERAQAFRRYNEAKLAAAKAQALVNAVSARSEALKKLSELFIAGYFAINSTKKTALGEQVQYNRLRDRFAKERLSK